MTTITTADYAALKAKIDAYHNSMRTLFPNQNGFTPEQIKQIVKHARIDREPTNDERSKVETYEFCHNPPDRYFLYINENDKTATTWTGEILGTVYLGHAYRDNFGGKRRSVTVRAVNGYTYHGTYFCSTGNYARIKRSKAA
jgi:hypothetical protein